MDWNSEYQRSVMKAKYTKRTGSPGNYKYYYDKSGEGGAQQRTPEDFAEDVKAFEKKLYGKEGQLNEVLSKIESATGVEDHEVAEVGVVGLFDLWIRADDGRNFDKLTEDDVTEAFRGPYEGIQSRGYYGDSHKSIESDLDAFPQKIDWNSEYQRTVMKAKYTKRTGSPGNYKYEYGDGGDKTEGGARAIPGMEGPIQFQGGRELYWDPKEEGGSYYDRGQDRYLTNDESREAVNPSKKTGLNEADAKLPIHDIAENISDEIGVKASINDWDSDEILISLDQHNLDLAKIDAAAAKYDLSTEVESRSIKMRKKYSWDKYASLDSDFGKPLPKKTKRKDESGFENKIRQWQEEVKDRPGRFPGGPKQAVAIAAQQSGVSKKAIENPEEDMFSPKQPQVQKANDTKGNAVKNIFDHLGMGISKAGLGGAASAGARYGQAAGAGYASGPGGGVGPAVSGAPGAISTVMGSKKSGQAQKAEMPQVEDDYSHHDSGGDCKACKAGKCQGMDKALMARSMAIPFHMRPGVAEQYDADSVRRSATQQTSRMYTSLAPQVRESIETQDEISQQRMQLEATSKCVSHGVIYKSQHCPMCETSKSLNMRSQGLRFTR